MEWAYLELGDVQLVAAHPRGVLVEYNSRLSRLANPTKRFLLAASGDTFVAEDTGDPANRRRREGSMPLPFERTALGKKARLAWPNGAVAIGQYAHLAGWDDRFAVVLDDRGFSVIDARADRVVRLMLPPDALTWDFAEPITSAGRLWIAYSTGWSSGGGVVAIPLADLEALAAGTFDVTLARHFPRRKPDATLACVYLWQVRNGDTAMIEIGDGKGGVDEPKLTIALSKLGLAKYTPVTLVDEVFPWQFAALDVPGGERVTIFDTAAITHPAKVTSTRAKDPTGVAKASARPSPRSVDALERLIAAVVDDPADDAPRAVLADALLEAGDPAGEAIASLRAEGKASPAKQRDALGPLGPYLTKVEFVGGFPAEATVSQNAPDANQHAAELDAACADFRLSLIHTLHSQPGRRAAPAIYARLAAAAKRLRRVDASRPETIEALITAGRDQVEYLERVDLGDAESMARLATATFDRVTHLHTLVGLAHLQPLINRLLKDKAKFFKRAVRHLVLDETMDRRPELLQALGPHWAKLPLASITVRGVTVTRAGITGDDAKLVAVARRAFG